MGRLTQTDVVKVRIAQRWRLGAVFDLDQVYEECESDFRTLWPNNRHVRPTIRKCRQRLKAEGFIEFVDGRGTYRRLK